MDFLNKLTADYPMSDMAKTLIMIGIFCILFGLGMYFVGKVPGMGKLPGDIYVKKENFSFYFPLTTCLIISAVFSLFFILWKQK